MYGEEIFHSFALTSSVRTFYTVEAALHCRCRPPLTCDDLHSSHARTHLHAYALLPAQQTSARTPACARTIATPCDPAWEECEETELMINDDGLSKDTTCINCAPCRRLAAVLVDRARSHRTNDIFLIIATTCHVRITELRPGDRAWRSLNLLACPVIIRHHVRVAHMALGTRRACRRQLHVHLKGGSAEAAIDNNGRREDTVQLSRGVGRREGDKCPFQTALEPPCGTTCMQ